jgi:glucosamine-6-phosphate deaminase
MAQREERGNPKSKSGAGGASGAPGTGAGGAASGESRAGGASPAGEDAYLFPIPPESDAPIPVEVVESDVDLYWHIAHSMYFEIEQRNRAGRRTVFIVPVGPVFQYRRFVELCRRRPIDLSKVHFFFMDEYMHDARQPIPAEDPLSFRGFVHEELVAPMPPEAGLPPEQVHFPDPREPDRYDEMLDELGGADICVAGVGINGHMAFNEPPEPGEEVTDEEFMSSPTRVLRLSRETRTINANTALRGAVDRVPEYAVTVGMRQILAARSLRIYLNRRWQSAVVRRILYGSVGASFPATFARRHPDAAITLTETVSETPRFALK